MKKEYNVTGMSCAACSASVERAVNKVAGVEKVAVNLLSGSMSVEGCASESDVIAAVKKAGYGASVKGKEGTPSDVRKDEDTMKTRLVSSLILLALHLYISMGSMAGLPLPSFITHHVNAVLQLTLSMVIMFINRKFFISGTKALLHKSPNMDTLVSMGALAAFIYSYAALMLMLLDPMGGHMYFHELYFEATSTILTLITLGKTLEARSKVKTASAIQGLMNLAPKTAVVERNGREETVEVSQLAKGDVFILYPGAAVPVDGVIISGVSTLDESSLTGESIPVDRSEGENVSAGTMNISGNLRVRATRVGEDTTLSQIIRLVNEASSSKAPVSRLADRVAGVFVPVVMAIAALTFILQLVFGAEFSYALSRAVAVLVISCPCALGLATPVAIMAASGKGASAGILFKDAAVLENTGKASVAVFDKTGTVTEGKMKVCDVIPLSGSKEELLGAASSLESMSEHPIAKAVAAHAASEGITAEKAASFMALPGYGVEGTLNGIELKGGSVKFISSVTEISADVTEKTESLSKAGKTPLLFLAGDRVLGIIAVRDDLKGDAAEAVSQLKAMGLRTVMLTGDNEKTAKAIAGEAGFDEVISGVLPSGKEEHIRRLQKNGRVIMVGDGINDAPSLTRADIGMAVSGGTDIAMDSASVILMNSSVKAVPAAVRLSRKTLTIIKENLFWAFIYNCIGIPLAAGVFTPFLGWSLNPMFASFAMSLSSVCVVTNALRLNIMDVFSRAHDRKKTFRKEEETVEKTLVIEGMMCSHCEMRVKKALMAVDGVVSADVSHEKGTAVVTLAKDIDADVLKKAVEAQDYSVLAVK